MQTIRKLCQEITASLLELFLPAACPACGRPPDRDDGIMLCRTCLAEVKPITGPICICCGLPFDKNTGANRLCGLCLSGHYRFDYARALFHYIPPLTTIISRFKYQGQTCGLKSFQTIYQQLPDMKEVANPDLIVPVPLHRKRLRKRGFNQALLLARALYPDQHALIDFKVLERHRYTEPQTNLSGKARRRNLKNAFRVTDPDSVAGKRVLLIDDVFTTGTTVNECAGILKQAGAGKVLVLTLARVDYRF